MHRTLHVALALVAAYIFFRYLLGFFGPFILGVGLAWLIEPLVRFLVRRGGFKRSLASLVAMLVLSLAGAAFANWGVRALAREASELLAAAPEYIAALQEWLAAYPFIPAEGMLDRAAEWLGGQSIRAVSFVPAALIGLLLVMVSAFFFSRDKDQILGILARHCPDWLAQYVRPVSKRLHEAAAGFLKTEFILMAIVAAICIVTLWFLHNPYAILLGLLIALLDSLPIVGAGLVLWPWAAYLAFSGQASQAAGLIVLYGLVTVVRNIIGPRILGEQIGIHPLAAIMSIFIGIKAFGLTGILAGPALVIAALAMKDLGGSAPKPPQTFEKV